MGEAMSDSTIEIIIFKQVLFIAHVYMHHDYVAMDCRNFLQHNRKKNQMNGSACLQYLGTLFIL